MTFWELLRRCAIVVGAAVVLGALVLALDMPSDDIPTADVYQEAVR